MYTCLLELLCVLLYFYYHCCYMLKGVCQVKVLSEDFLLSIILRWAFILAAGMIDECCSGNRLLYHLNVTLMLCCSRRFGLDGLYLESSNTFTLNTVIICHSLGTKIIYSSVKSRYDLKIRKIGKKGKIAELGVICQWPRGKCGVSCECVVSISQRTSVKLTPRESHETQ